MSRQQQDTLEQESLEVQKMDISKLREPLEIDQIDFRVQSINNGGYATILAYKDARVDQHVLDNVVGPLGWKREHLNSNKNCIVSIWCDDKKQWVSKEDTGTESNTEAAKGLASDSFKRACFNWGIGRELYDYPLIQVKLRDNEFTTGGGKPKGTWALKPNNWDWLSQFSDGKLSCLMAADKSGSRFSWGELKEEPKISHEQSSILYPFVTRDCQSGEGIEWSPEGQEVFDIHRITAIEDLPASKFEEVKRHLGIK